MGKHYSLGIYNYDREKICDLYDSNNDLAGQAFGISVTEEMNGYHTLEFSIPYVIESGGKGSGSVSSLYGQAIYGRSIYGGTGGAGGASRNYRWDFLRSDYLIRYTCGEKSIWFVANKPTKAKSGKKIIGNVSCCGFEQLLKTRNIYMEFDDENGIGTIGYLIGRILTGTGWTYNNASDTMTEKDGTTEKIRSLKSDGKRGALDLITTVCNLFQARPIFDTDAMTVTIRAMTNRQQVLEGEVGRNLNAITVKHDSSNIATRVYVEGEYGDYGYVGIDDVEVDGEPWGLPFLVNFDYYREIGVFKARHEAALATYLHDIREKKIQIREAGAAMIACDDAINNMIGQCRMAVYYKDESLTTPMYTYGGITSEQAALNIDDEVVILKNNNTHTYETWTGDPDTQLAGAYGVVKFDTKAAGKIGAAEVQIEAKEKEIERLQRKINTFVSTDPRIAEYEAEIERLENEIDTIYNGTEDTDGLYKMMSDVMKPDGLLYDYSEAVALVNQLNAEQDDIEATFIAAMGYMLRDGYWSNTNYTVGQEEFLYADAVDMANEMSHPVTDYTFDYVRVTEDFDISPEDIEINAIFKLYDRELQIDDKMFIKRVTYGVDDKSLGSIEVSNQDITLTGNDLGTLLSRMSQLADLIEQKNALYDRARALSNDGTLFAERLNGQIDVLRTQILSSTSNWHTDDRGNILFESADGGSAMMLSGSGIMLASGKDEAGEWDWRLCMDGGGMTADEIVAGFISADRIEAGSIQADHLASSVGAELELTSNTGLTAYVQSTAEEVASSMRLTDSEFVTMFNDNVKPGVDGAINDVQNNLNNYMNDVSVYMKYDNTGTLTLGRSDSDFKTQITNTKMSFTQGNSEVAYISNQSMYITNARVTERLSVGTNNGNGYFDWTVTPTGLGLKWRGT